MYPIIITVIAAAGWLAAVALAGKAGYLTKILVKLGLQEQKQKINWTAFSWDSCLQKLEYKADAVFFGDSIIRGGDFHKMFPNKKIVNLGCSGDTLSGMINRLSMVQAVDPEKVFFMGGINGLTEHNLSNCIKKYAQLLEQLKKTAPNAQLYVHSLLPIAKEKEKHICKNATIRRFNDAIRAIAEEKGAIYIDLQPYYAKDGFMNPDLTIDGLHLYPESYEKWMHVLAQYMED